VIKLNIKSGECLCKLCWAQNIVRTADYAEVDIGYTITELCEDCAKPYIENPYTEEEKATMNYVKATINNLKKL